MGLGYERADDDSNAAVLLAERFLLEDDRFALPDWIRTCAPLNARYS